MTSKSPGIAGLYALCDVSQNPRLSHCALAHALLLGGARLLQLRMKGETDSRKIRQVAAGLLELKRDFAFTLILNDFVDIAADLPVDGVHVGAEDMPLLEARRKLGESLLLGYSAHSLEEAKQAAAQGADYVALGAIFPTKSKGPGHPVQGLEVLRRTVRAVAAPVVAIGGIHRDNFAQVVSTGVAAVAMIGALTRAENIVEEARWYVQTWRMLRG